MTLGNDEAEILADALEDYLYLLHLDLSKNRLEGAKGGAAIARIIMRKIVPRGGVQILNLNVAYNKLGNLGFGAIVHVLLHPEGFLERLNVGYNGIDDVRLLMSIETLYDRIFLVQYLILDGNPFKTWSYNKLSTLLGQAN